MFGSKFKIWMENHIVRPKRKSQQQDKEKTNQAGQKGPILESSESLAHSDTGISSGSQQILSSSNTDNNEGYCTTTMESNRSRMDHCLHAVNLSSPESAYSTGYSTDGTSPGGTGPPEYYINIRTGKHYFPSPAPTPTTPQPTTGFSQVHPPVNQCIATSFLTNDVALSSIPTYPSTSFSTQNVSDHPAQHSHNCCGGFSPALTPFVPGSKTREAVPGKRSDLSSSVPSQFEIFNFSKSPAKKAPPKSPLSTLKSFLKSPKQDKGKTKLEEAKTPVFQNKKKSASPVKNKKWYKQPFQKFGHRRMDSSEGAMPKSEATRKEVAGLDRNFLFSASSPRQRNRIRTNPWLPTEPMSSQNFHNLRINFSPSLVGNRSCTNTPLQNRKANDGAATHNRAAEVPVSREDSTECANGPEKAIGRRVERKILFETSDHSEEDLTLHEMMGTFNESYVYEKETDILSDSDPTDCEDYVSDSEADNGGDEQDSHDDELDFIDNGSVVEAEGFMRNTGKCTYHEVYAKKNNFLSKSGRHHSEMRKSLKKDCDAKGKKSKDDKRRKSFRKTVRNTEQKPPGSRERATEGPKLEPATVVNMSKLLMQRVNGKNGSKSADGTPVCARRRKLVKELRETHIGAEREVNGEKSVSAIDSTLEDDTETDKKYRELILEAENILVRMQKSPGIQIKKKGQETSNESDSLNIWRTAETLCARKNPENRKKPDVVPRRNLELTLAVDSKKSGNAAKNSFKAKSSAHSPLDPLGPTFKNFTIFREVDKKISSSSSEDSESSKVPVPERKPDPTLCSVPIAFQSVDLGKPLTSYCPQSEPVKRKIYSCSKTYDKLVKRFENQPKVLGSETTRIRHPSLASKKRSDSWRPVPTHEMGIHTSPRRRERNVFINENAERAGNFFYNPVYSPYSTPISHRKGCNRNNVSSPNVCRRLSYDIDIIR